MDFDSLGLCEQRRGGGERIIKAGEGWFGERLRAKWPGSQRRR